MFHDRRIWALADIDSPRDLAEKLPQQTFGTQGELLGTRVEHETFGGGERRA